MKQLNLCLQDIQDLLMYIGRAKIDAEWLGELIIDAENVGGNLKLTLEYDNCIEVIFDCPCSCLVDGERIELNALERYLDEHLYSE